MLNTTTLRIEDSVLKNISKMANKLHLDRGTFLRQLIMKAYGEELLETNINEYQKGKISLSELAEKTNKTIWETMEILKQRKIESRITLIDIENSSK